MNTGQPFVDFGPYMKRILKQLHPKLGLTADASVQLNALINVIGGRIAGKASFLCSNTIGKQEIKPNKNGGTCEERAAMAATRLVLPGELAKHAVSEGTRAVTKLSDKVDVSLKFPILHTEKLFKQYHCGRVTDGASVFLTAVLEYLSAEYLELSGNAARGDKRSRITVRDLSIASMNDEELNKLQSTSWNFSGGGVMPHIHSVLLPKTK